MKEEGRRKREEGREKNKEIVCSQYGLQFVLGYFFLIAGRRKKLFVRSADFSPFLIQKTKVFTTNPGKD